MGKKRVRLLCADADREALQPILDTLQARGVQCEAGEKDTLLAVLSARFYADETLKNALLEALGAGAENVLPLRLDESDLPAEIKTALYARNIIPAFERSAEQTAERVAAALPEKKKRMGAAFIAGAAVLAALAGVLIWRALPKEEQSEAVPAAAETIAIPEGLGLSAEDLKNIRSVVIVGDEYHFLPSSSGAFGGAPEVHDYAVDDADGPGWFSKEDGHAYGMARYDDLRFLALMPNLKNIGIALADIGQLPDLSGVALRRLELWDCTVDRLDWFDASKLETVCIYGCPITDYSPLGASTMPIRAEFGFSNEVIPDLSGFAPASLSSLNMSGSPASIQMPPLNSIKSLAELRITGMPVENLDFLTGCGTRDLWISDCTRLRDISGVSSLTNLLSVEIENCPQIRDYSPIGGCGSLQSVYLNSRDDSIRDVSFLADLQNLRRIDLHGCSIPDLRFLPDNAERSGFIKSGFHFNFGGSCGSFAGLEKVKRFERLELHLRGRSFDEAAALLQDAEIGTLVLGRAADLDLGAIPADVMHLTLLECGFGRDLRALAGKTLTVLELENIPRLTSLDGLQELGAFGKNGTGSLSVSNCPRLSDWSALEGMSLNELRLAGVYSLPDFGSFVFHSLRLDSLDWMEDLRCLDALDAGYPGYTSFSLPGMGQIRDLSPIARVISHGSLEVPPQLEEQAQELQQQGKISYYSVVYPQGGWELDRSELSLLSLDELNTLPNALLKRVTTLAVAGDTVYDPELFEVEYRWVDDGNFRCLVDRASGEETRIRGGAVEDLHMFSALTGLRRLFLCDQPLSSLDGIQALEALEELNLKYCPKLSDVSPVFAMQNLKNLDLRGTPVQSIQGVQNLFRLQWLELSQTDVTDLSPLAQCDFSESEQNGGFGLCLDDIPCRDFSPISAVPYYSHLNVFNTDCRLWIDLVRNSRIEQLWTGHAGLNDELLERLVREHPELRRLNLAWNEDLTDLTPVLALQELEYLELSEDMYAALDSLPGGDLPFELSIQQ